MNPYTHIILAQQLIETLHPENLTDYFWGAIAPDIRYVARIPRETTHKNKAQLQELFQKYPHQKSFIQGYQVHCLLDYVDLTDVAYQYVPLRWLKKVAPKLALHRQITLFFELYCIHTYPNGIRIEGQTNEILSDLGITALQIQQFLAIMQPYYTKPGFKAAMNTMKSFGMISNNPVGLMIQTAAALMEPPFIRSQILKHIHGDQMEAYAIAYAKDWLKQRPWQSVMSIL